MGRVLGQPPTVIRNVKNILAAKETASASRWGSSFAVFFVLCSSVIMTVRRRAFFVSEKRWLT